MRGSVGLASDIDIITTVLIPAGAELADGEDGVAIMVVARIMVVTGGVSTAKDYGISGVSQRAHTITDIQQHKKENKIF